MTTWTGVFESTRYGTAFVNGFIEIVLEDDKKYSTDATVKYNGMYRQGDSIECDVDVDGDKVKIITEGIELDITSRKDDLIKGTYVKFNPVDNGTFKLWKKNSEDSNDDDHKLDGSCILL